MEMDLTRTFALDRDTVVVSVKPLLRGKIGIALPDLHANSAGGVYT